MLQEIILVVTKISEKESQYIANNLIEICCIHDQNKLFTVNLLDALLKYERYMQFNIDDSNENPFI